MPGPSLTLYVYMYYVAFALDPLFHDGVSGGARFLRDLNWYFSGSKVLNPSPAFHIGQSGWKVGKNTLASLASC